MRKLSEEKMLQNWKDTFHPGSLSMARSISLKKMFLFGPRRCRHALVAPQSLCWYTHAPASLLVGKTASASSCSLRSGYRLL